MSNEPTIAQKSPYALEVSEGREYYWCSCGKSQTQPLCDGSHQGSNFEPVAFTAEKSGTVYLCGCKKTEGQPFCDGSHKAL